MNRARAFKGSRRRVCVVGPSSHFLSGITYYAFGLCNALEYRCAVSALLIRRLLPRMLYPGHRRVGTSLTNVELAPSIPRYDGVDWYWLPSLLGAIAFLIRRRPEVLVLQWWTGTVLHTYLVLAWIARAFGARVIIEFHEALDTGEAAVPGARAYVRRLAPALFALASHHVVHSEYDAQLVCREYGLDRESVDVIPHATYDYHGPPPQPRPPRSECVLLYFGVIRPFKGVEDLIRAFDAMPEEDVGGYRLVVAGETWEHHTLPAELIRSSRHRHRITFLNRYLSDEEVRDLFAGADVVVLPYRRSSQSGPLHLAMHFGLPVVVTAVGGLVEAVRGYEGAVLVPPQDPQRLREGIERARGLAGRRFASPHDWDATAARYAELVERVVEAGRRYQGRELAA